MYFEKLSELDKSRIENYIKAYAQHSTSEKMAPLQDILKPWDEAKSGYLSTIFKDNLIITKPIQFQEGETELLDKVEVQFVDECHHSQSLSFSTPTNYMPNFVHFVLY